jgi:hypothetical protein
MALYARSDMMSVSIPRASHPGQSGGCGATHTRPVTRGNPVKTWKLECPECETHLRGDLKQRIIRASPGDKERGIAPTLNHVPDADPHWANTPEGVPPTPDEQNIHKIRAEQGQRQLDRLTAFAALKQSGMKIPPQAQWLIDNTLEEIAELEKTGSITGSIVCADGHDNSPGAKFCGECGMNMNVRATVSPAAEELPTLLEDLIPLHSLHIATLRKRAREARLNDKGTKAQLIERLSA